MKRNHIFSWQSTVYIDILSYHCTDFDNFLSLIYPPAPVISCICRFIKWTTRVETADFTEYTDGNFF
ncbi:MAG: hypothetical protein EDM70_06390 [Candidatus Brocadia sp. AMX2]|nr:MAG: hypothetical protein EDM70_06390 [Candidatus Brocadia sp. AMX2]